MNLAFSRAWVVCTLPRASALYTHVEGCVRGRGLKILARMRAHPPLASDAYEDRLFSCKKINTHLLTGLGQKFQILQVASAQTAVRSVSRPEVGVYSYASFNL